MNNGEIKGTCDLLMKNNQWWYGQIINEVMTDDNKDNFWYWKCAIFLTDYNLI